MAYKLNKAKRLIEEIELEDGQIINVDINVGKISIDFNKHYNNILRLQNIKGEPTPQDLEDLGVAIIELITLVVGADGSKRILEYYNDNYMDLLENILPFIVDVVSPAIKNYIKEKNTDAAGKYKSKQRRKFQTFT